MIESQLSPKQRSAQQSFRCFVNREIIPFAKLIDKEQRLPQGLVSKLAKQGHLGAVLPLKYGGSEMDIITYGLLHEEYGRGCSSSRGLLTVHNMVGHAILTCGNPGQIEEWIPRMASGATIAAFALTEPDVGSDANSVQATASRSGNDYVLTGRKKWISFGTLADLFLIIVKCDRKPCAFLVEKDSPGFSMIPIFGMLGHRGSMLAELRLEDCRIPKENLIGKIGFGFSDVAGAALNHGRYSIAWGCAGLGRACLEDSLRYTNTRKQFGSYLRDFQLIQRMITEMVTGVRAARLLCYQAGYLRQIGHPRAVSETLIAKYFASQMLIRVASDAVQIHGAAGCSEEYPVQRYLRDAKVAEIIEGTTQVHQIIIAKYANQEAR